MNMRPVFAWIAPLLLLWGPLANATASNIIAVNILGTNGVVHVIDQVLRP